MKNILYILCIYFPVISFCQETKYDIIVRNGTDYFKKGELTLAEEKYKQAIVLDSTKVEAYYALGQLYQYYCSFMDTGCEQSILLFKKSLNIDSAYKDPYFYIGRSLGVMNNFTEALHYFNI